MLGPPGLTSPEADMRGPWAGGPARPSYGKAAASTGQGHAQGARGAPARRDARSAAATAAEQRREEGARGGPGCGETHRWLGRRRMAARRWRDVPGRRCSQAALQRRRKGRVRGEIGRGEGEEGWNTRNWGMAHWRR